MNAFATLEDYEARYGAVPVAEQAAVDTIAEALCG